MRFRCWDKELKRMALSFPLFKSNFIESEQLQDGTLMVMIETGLKDRNDKDIYEGDIVKMNLQFSNISQYMESEGDEGDFDFTGEVVILPSMGVCLKNPNVVDNLEDNVTWKHKGYKNVRAYRSEVIGNIYDNPLKLQV